MTIRLRPHRVPFRFAGPDAQKLLNDVLTARIVAEAGPLRWWALLSPQGKVQAEGLVGWADGAFWLDADASVADGFFKRMRMYKLRAQLEIEDLRGSHRVGWTDEAEEGGEADGRDTSLGRRVIATTADAAVWAAADERFARRRISAGVAELGPDFAPDSVFPHDIGMDFLGGVDFRKGCYIGQEVVSRMQHRGTARRRPVIVAGVPDGAAAGAPVVIADREAGTIGTPVDGEAVAIIRLDRVDEGARPTIGGLPVELRLPSWATYHFGEATAEA
jgi:folate-binding protein YgfZ